MRPVLFLLSLGTALAAPTAAQEDLPGGDGGSDPVLEELHARLRLTFEQVEVSAAEELGLFGLHVDLRPAPGVLPGLYVGLGGFGAATGHRGGFFTGGVGAGWDQDLLGPLHLEVGGFFGGGGGGAAPQGSGLMLRGFGAAWLELGRLGLRVELSRVDFPDGAIAGTQLAGGLSWEIRPWVGRRGLAALPGGAAPAGEAGPPLRLGFSGQAHVTGGDSRRTGNRPLDETVALPGVRVDRFLTEDLFATLAAHGAVSGGVDGYAQLLAGLGWRLPLAGGLALEPVLQAGAGGGGAVDTGGGILLQPGAVFRLAVGPRSSVYAGAAWTWAPTGHFEAATVEGGLTWESRPLGFPPDAAGRRAPADTVWEDWEVQIAHKSWFPDSGARLKGGAPMEDIQLVGFAVARPLTPWLDLSGQAFGAWDGGIGGYAEGLLGADLHLPGASLQPFLRILGGGAGGGGVDLGSGLIYEGEAGLRLDLGQGLSLELAGGRVEARSGSFGADLLRAALAVDLALPVAEAETPGP